MNESKTSQIGASTESGCNNPVKISPKQFYPRGKMRAYEALLREVERKAQKQEKIREKAEKRGKQIRDDRYCIKVNKAA
jgi:hypothetical protein